MRRGRLNLRYLAMRAREELFGIERGLMATIWHLLWSPQRVVREFVEGGPPRFYSPIRYFVIVTALSVLLGSTTLSFLDQTVAKALVGVVFDSEQAAGAWVSDWNALLYSPLMLSLALCLRYFYRAKPYNLAEQLVIATYGWSQLVLIALVSLLLLGGLRDIAGPRFVNAYALLVIPSYWFYFCARVLPLRGVADWLRCLVTVPAAFGMFALVMFVAVQVIKGLM